MALRVKKTIQVQHGREMGSDKNKYMIGRNFFLMSWLSWSPLVHCMYNLYVWKEHIFDCYNKHF